MRSTWEFCSETKTHLGIDIAEKLGRILEGMGGGHTGAASFNGAGSSKVACEAVLKLLREKLNLEPQKLD